MPDELSKAIREREEFEKEKAKVLASILAYQDESFELAKRNLSDLRRLLERRAPGVIIHPQPFGEVAKRNTPPYLAYGKLTFHYKGKHLLSDIMQDQSSLPSTNYIEFRSGSHGDSRISDGSSRGASRFFANTREGFAVVVYSVSSAWGQPTTYTHLILEEYRSADELYPRLEPQLAAALRER